jgi:uncharacterized membrane protein YdjX (TVP38/TMEM64 family)
MRSAEQDSGAPTHHHGGVARSRRVREIAVGVVAVAVVAAIFLGPGPEAAWNEIRDRLGAWQAWVGRNPLVSVVTVFLLFTFATALPLPVLTVVSLTAGALFGTPLGTVVASLAYTAGVTVSFLTVRWFLRDPVRHYAGRWMRWVERGVERDGGFYLLMLRMMPSVPFFVVNMLMALTPMRTRTYALFSWVGVLPMAFLCSGVGTELAALKSPSDAVSLPVLGALAALAVTPLLVRKLLRIVRRPVPLPDSP